MVIGIVVIAIPAMIAAPGVRAGYPPIHDITTETDNPPEFSAVLAARGETSNSVVYTDKVLPEGRFGGEDGGKHYSEIQAKYYPDIQPISLDMSRSDAFDKALTTAKGQGWEIVAEEPNSGIIEGTATSRWMGFKDDVVIRVTEQKGQAIVDIRSSSRVGVGDVGLNANRIRAFTAALTSP